MSVKYPVMNVCQESYLPENQNINPKKTGLPTVTLLIIENRCHKVPNWHIVYIAEKIPGNYQN